MIEPNTNEEQSPQQEAVTANLHLNWSWRETIN